MDLRDRFGDASPRGGFSRDMKLSAVVIVLIIGAVLFLTMSSPEDDKSRKSSKSTENLFDSPIDKRYSELRGNRKRESKIQITEIQRERMREKKKREKETQLVDQSGIDVLDKPKIQIDKPKDTASKIKKATQKTAPAKKNVYHTVKSGEYLSTIAKKYYGDANKWYKIARDNDLTEEQANNLWVGQKLLIKNVSSGRSSGSKKRLKVSDFTAPEPKIQINVEKDYNAQGTYVVKPGDTYVWIAEKLYGDRTKWKRLLDLNDIPATKLRPGMRIKY